MLAKLQARASGIESKKKMRELPFKLDPGDIVEIEGVAHVFDRIDPDGRITFTSLRQRVEYMITDPLTGFPIKPQSDDIARLMTAGRFIKRAPDLEGAARRIARKMELDAADARATDENADFRITFLRAYDASPCGLSDRALRQFAQQLLNDPEIARLPGARMYVGSTFRSWIHNRGHRNDRKMRDGISMTGKMPRKRKVHHPIEILEYYIALAHRKTTSRLHAKTTVLKAWEDYKGEINRINRGVPSGRPGENYSQPAKPYRYVSQTTFWRICNDARSSATTRAKHGAQAVYSRYGGGGRSEQPKSVGALAVMDDTPVPTIFLVDEENRIPLGQATLVAMMDCYSRAILGWDLSWEEASSATALRTFVHANTPKAVPRDLDELHPELKWICVKPTALLVDNLVAHHSRHFEDSLLDIGTDVHFAGSGMPRDKAGGERVLGTILDLFFKDLPAATYDIPHAREFGFDPATMTMVSLNVARETLLRAICTYHLAPHSGLKRRQPALVFKQHAATHGLSLVDDIDEFHRSIGIVEYDVKLRPSGVVIQGLRYSDFQSTRVLIDDLVALQGPSQSKGKTISLTVKVKYSPDDMGYIHVWNERTKKYVSLPCAQFDYADGMPLWAHKRVLAIAKQEALDYSSTEELIEIRKRLFETVRAIHPHASEQDRRTVAKLRENPLFRRVMGSIVEVVDERSDLVEPDAARPSHVIGAELAAPSRLDATAPTPRPGRNDASVGRTASLAGKTKNRDRRDAGAPKSTTQTDNRRNRPQDSGSNLKWGDSYD